MQQLDVQEHFTCCSPTASRSIKPQKKKLKRSTFLTDDAEAEKHTDVFINSLQTMGLNLI